MTLPNSKLQVSFATGLHDYADSCAGEEGCFWTLRFYPTHVKAFTPDVPVRYTFADYASLRDPLVTKALELVQSR